MPPVDRARDREVPGISERAASAAFLIWGASLPFLGLGRWTFHHEAGIELPDLVFIAASPIFAWLLFDRTRLRAAVSSPMVLVCAAVLAVAAVTASVRGDLQVELRDLARHAGRLAVVTAMVGMAVSGARLATSALVGLAAMGTIVAATSLVLFALHVMTGVTTGAHAGVFVGPMPFAAAWPRLTGTAGPSPQHMGEILVATLAALLLVPRGFDGRNERVRRGALLVTSMALVATCSAALLGAVLMGIGWLALRERIAPLFAAFGAAVAIVAVVWVVHVGPPEDRAVERECSQIDSHHTVTAFLDLTDTRCRREVRAAPYRAMLTTYRDAVEASLAAIGRHPLTGVGRHGFAAFSRSRALERAGPGVTRVSHYTSPHSLLGLAASHGWSGAICLLALLIVIGSGMVRAPNDEARAAWVAVASVVALGVSSDILDARVSWALLGAAAAVTMHGARAGT